MFALLLTYITGLLIIIISYVMEPILGFLHSRKRYGTYKHLEWITNSELQQQRLAHEATGSGYWENCTDYVPVTDAKVKLRCLDLSNPDHPRILNSNQETRKSSREHQHQEVGLNRCRDSHIGSSSQHETGTEQITNSNMDSFTLRSEDSDSHFNLPPSDSSNTEPDMNMRQSEKVHQVVLDDNTETIPPSAPLRRRDIEAVVTPGTLNGNTVTPPNVLSRR
jgi:hypothetical protein